MLALEKRGLPFTGADARFFRLDTIKIDMKRELTATRAPTPKYLDLTFEPVNEEEKQALIIKIGSMRMPVIVCVYQQPKTIMIDLDNHSRSNLRRVEAREESLASP